MSEVILDKKKIEIDFVDLASQQKKIRSNIDQAIKRVLDHGQYIMGPEVQMLEKELSIRSTAKHVISCANGTDALALGLMAKNIGPGDAVFVPSFTFVATAEVVLWLGATPIYIDVLEDTYNISSDSLEQGIATAKKHGLQPKGIIAVDIFGQPADYDLLTQIAEKHDLWIMCDAAQSYGAHYKGKPVGSIGAFTTTSFYPAKPLGCYGDGGALFTNDDESAQIIRSLRVHGQGTDKYDNVRVGMNGRLDTIQAAILIEKLKVFSNEIQARQRAAEYYTKALKQYVKTPVVIEGSNSVWAQYTMRLPQNIDRSHLMKHLKSQGIPTVIYYPKPIHQQKAYMKYPTANEGPLPVSEKLSNEVLSLPISGYITQETQDFVIDAFIEYMKMN